MTINFFTAAAKLPVTSVVIIVLLLFLISLFTHAITALCVSECFGVCVGGEGGLGGGGVSACVRVCVGGGA